MDQPAAFSRTLLADRLVQGVRHEARRHRRRDAPADDPAGEDINDKGHMDHPHSGRHAGEVRHPELVLGAVAVNSRLTLSSGVIRAGLRRIRGRIRDRGSVPAARNPV